MFTSELKEQLDRLTSRYDQRQAALLPILHSVQEKHGFISQESEQDVADYLGIPVVHVHQVVCFYHLFTQKPLGKCHFSVCQTTACSLVGAEEIISHIESRLGIKAGETTQDGKFSLGRVECLGACEIAPMLQCNKDYEGHLTKEKVDALIEKYK